MGYASRVGRARVNSKSPQALAVCMRCGIWHNRVDLQFQFQWAGAQFRNTYLLVCDECLDVPQEQLRAITLPADPVPVYLPSPEDFVAASTDYRSLAGSTTDFETGIPIPSNDLRVTEDCKNRTTFPFGVPTGETQNAVMPYDGSTQTVYGTALAILSVVGNGNTTVNVTCSAVHGMVQQDNPQIAVQGLSNSYACGMFSVTVLTATAFSYQTYGNIPSGSLLTATTRITTCKIGLPYGYDTIPQITGSSMTTKNELTDESGILIETEGGLYLELG